MNNAIPSQDSGKLTKTLRIILVALVAASLCLPLSMQSAYAEPTSAEKQAEADEVSARLAALDEQMVQIRADYEAAVRAHDAAVAGMEEAQARIDAAEATIKETQARLGTRANQMYRQGGLNFLDVLFGAATFEEFTTTWDMINVINQENANLIQANKDAQAEAQAAHDEYSVQEKEAAAREAEAQLIKENTEAIIAEERVLFDSLSAEVAALVEAEQAARLAAEAAAQLAANNTNTNNNGNNDNYTPVPEYVAPPAPTGGYGDVVAAAASRIGCPYVWGATGPDYFDCSGLTSWCYQQAGRGYITRTDYTQYNAASARWPYTSGGAEPGDVLWWPGHVAIYVGGGTYIHAPYPGASVCYSSWDINSSTVLRF